MSVVICAHSNERFRYLTEAIASLEAQTRPPVEIVVAVDRNPELLSRVRSTHPSVIAVANSHHAGAGGARNSGVAVSRGEIVAFIDDDVCAEPDWLEHLLPVFRQKEVLGAGGKIVPSWTSARPSWFPEEFDWVVGCTYRGLPGTTSVVRNVISANMAVRREVFDSVDGFLADFGKQGADSEPEETEFCIRAHASWPDHHWIYVPAARVRHTVTPERETWRYFLKRCKNEGRGKARMTGHAQVGAELSSERRYATHVLPLGVLHGLRDASRGDRTGLARSGAIVVGLVVTAAYYLATSRKLARTR